MAARLGPANGRIPTHSLLRLAFVVSSPPPTQSRAKRASSLLAHRPHKTPNACVRLSSLGPGRLVGSADRSLGGSKSKHHQSQIAIVINCSDRHAHISRSPQRTTATARAMADEEDRGWGDAPPAEKEKEKTEAEAEAVVRFKTVRACLGEGSVERMMGREGLDSPLFHPSVDHPPHSCAHRHSNRPRRTATRPARAAAPGAASGPSAPGAYCMVVVVVK